MSSMICLELDLNKVLSREAALDRPTRRLSQQLKDAIDVCVHCETHKETAYGGVRPDKKIRESRKKDLADHFSSLSLSLKKNENFVTAASVALVYAAMTNCLHCAEILLKHGAKTAFHDPDVYGTAMYQAVVADHPEMLKLLIQHGAKVNANCTVFGTKPLHEATTKYNNSCIQVLVDAGADVNGRRSSDGFSVLTHALLQTEDDNGRRAFRNFNNIRTLLKNGANLSLKLANHSLHESLLQCVQKEYHQRDQIEMSSLLMTLKMLFDDGYKPKLSEFVHCISTLSNVEGEVVEAVKFFMGQFTINVLDVVHFDVFMSWVLENICEAYTDREKVNLCLCNLRELRKCFTLLTRAIVIYPSSLEARLFREKAHIFQYKAELLMEITESPPHHSDLLVKYVDTMKWIEEQVTVLPSLKNLSRCVLRKALGTPGLSQKLEQVELPKELVSFTLLEDI
ncbi:PREDICTED: uncharacterized protein LOC109471083 [Branchiostoma belcheri]|uniref:Uncharacterized protein LOC109471083 n=1 Tax=Branchiostoma belcheri TaxID=7741 RepID=A0A6P4YN66_BRABE|nr:PREDICTED: uncharacterized protein LOC109471083 [Branchiostoma belcheri]KAI8487619.1 Ankyrin repeat and SOCS box protein 6 [Branchiostoma belcheri]